MTQHSLIEDDCRNLSFIPDASVDLIITHPPSLGAYGAPWAHGQFAAITDYDEYLKQLDSVWGECSRVLSGGGHLACVVSPVVGEESELPLSADVYARIHRLGLELTRAIRWLPQNRVELDDSTFYGAPNQPCGELGSASQDILVFRKPGERLVSVETQVASRMPADFYAACASAVWLIPAEDDPRHPQCFPIELAERLIRMFSYSGDTVLDPFAGIGTVSTAAGTWGRNSIAVEIEERYFDSMANRLANAAWPDGEIEVTRGPLAARAAGSEAITAV